jgi:hypothetical protein
LLRTPVIMTQAPSRWLSMRLTQPCLRIARYTCPGTGGVLSSVRLANASGRATYASCATVPANE